MREKALGLLGLMRRANAVEIGEINTGTATRAGKTKLLLLASDASDNARDRAESFARGRNVTVITAPFTKEDISSSVGVGGCSMAAITDIGFANAFMKALAGTSEEFGPAAEEIERRFSRAEHRKKETASETNRRTGKRRTNI